MAEPRSKLSRRNESLNRASRRALAGMETQGVSRVATVDAGALRRAVSRASSYTDSNYHNYSLRVFSRLFKYDDLTSDLDQLIREHERLGHMSGDMMERRTRIYRELLDRVGRDYGDDVVRNIRKGL